MGNNASPRRALACASGLGARYSLWTERTKIGVIASRGPTSKCHKTQPRDIHPNKNGTTTQIYIVMYTRLLKRRLCFGSKMSVSSLSHSLFRSLVLFRFVVPPGSVGPQDKRWQPWVQVGNHYLQFGR